MTVSIVANTAAKYAQSSLRLKNDALLVNTQRLSSGSRVVSAGSDAAAMAVGTGLKIDNAVLKTAIVNATSGLSMLQVADGALGQISDLLTRMQALATQASSSQLDDPSRALVNGEFQNLKAEVDRIAKVTNFNEVKLLAGVKAFTVTGGGDMTADGVSGTRFDQTIVTGSQAFRYSYNASTEALTLARIDGGSTVSQTIDLTNLMDATAGAGLNLGSGQKLDVSFSQLGVTLTLDDTFNRAANIAVTSNVTPGAGTTVATPTFAASAINISTDTAEGLHDLASGYNDTTGVLTLPLISNGTTVTLGALPGITYKVGANPATGSGNASDDIVGAGTAVQVFVDLPTGGQTQLLGTLTVGATATTLAGAGSVTLGVGAGLVTAVDDGETAPTHLTYKIGTGVITGEDLLGVDVPAMTASSLQLTNVDVTTAGNANTAIDTLKAALVVLNQGRASVGAQQLRLEAVSNNLGVVTDNNEAARSALMDVDVAKEITEYSSNQAMLQAGMAMLGRANQLPDLLLELLKSN